MNGSHIVRPDREKTGWRPGTHFTKHAQRTLATMPPKWLYAVDRQGLTVAAAFAERLQSGDAIARRELQHVDLTPMYRRGYAAPGVDIGKSLGLFWSDAKPHAVLPLIYSGSRPPNASLPAYVAFREEPHDASTARLVTNTRRGLVGNEGLEVTVKRREVTAVITKPNPKVELVVVNKHDRAALIPTPTFRNGLRNARLPAVRRISKHCTPTTSDGVRSAVKLLHPLAGSVLPCCWLVLRRARGVIRAGPITWHCAVTARAGTDKLLCRARRGAVRGISLRRSLPRTGLARK